jgi:hypothetical protein
MKKTDHSNWPLGLAVIVLLIAVTFAYLTRPTLVPRIEPSTALPLRGAHVDHHDIVKGPYKTGQDVTRECLTCHKDAAQDVMKTSHWTW